MSDHYLALDKFRVPSHSSFVKAENPKLHFEINI